MKLHLYLVFFAIALLSFDTQQNPIHKKWNLVAEEITYLNFDYTPYDRSRNRFDTIKNQIVQFLPDGAFKSSEGNGTYTMSPDSIYLSINGKHKSFHYKLSHAKLTMESDTKWSSYIIRSRLYLE